MKFHFSLTRLGVSTLLASASGLVLAQDAASANASKTLKDVVVTATRVEQPISDLVADVMVLDRVDIERSGASALSDILGRLPGFELTRNGGPGTSTSVYVRGAESRYLAVYVDGVRIDSQSGSGGASWELIPVEQIDRLEVLRGPAAAVYGSDAIGGVLQIFTRKGEGAPSPYVILGAGIYGTTKLAAGVSGSTEKVDYALSAANEYSKGFNASALSTQNGDDDGYRMDSYSGRLGLQVNASHRVEVTALASDLNSGYDTSAKDDRNLKKLQTGALSWRGKWSDAYSTTVSYSNSQDQYETTPVGSFTKTNLSTYFWQNELRLGQQLFTLAAERREDQLNNANTTPKDTDHFQNSIAGGYGWSNTVHSVQLNVRHDADSVFGAVNTGAIGYGYAFAPKWRATGSAGTAFRAPTLYQRFSIYGSADMQAETSRNYELGLHHAKGPNTVDVTVYYNDVSNLISFVQGQGTCPGNVGGSSRSSGCYFNTAQARYKGITVSAKHVFDGFALRGSLDLADPRDVSNTGTSAGKLLPKRSTHHGVVGLDVNALGWQWGAEMQAYSHRYNDPANSVYLPGYVLLGVSAEKQLNRSWKLMSRLDNATDTQYQTVNGYATAGRSLYVGVKWAP